MGDTQDDGTEVLARPVRPTRSCKSTPTVGSKPDPPATKPQEKPAVHDDEEWSEKEELKLFQLWKGEVSLYNKHHKLYRKKLPKAKSLEKVAKSMGRDGK